MLWKIRHNDNDRTVKQSALVDTVTKTKRTITQSKLADIVINSKRTIK